MKRRLASVHLTAITALLAFVTHAANAIACTGDVECKGDRICAQGSCQMPASTASLHAPTNDSSPAPITPMSPTESPSSEPIWGLAIAGAVVFPTAYALSLVTTLVIDESAGNGIQKVSGYMAVPIAGPWIAIADDGGSGGIGEDNDGAKAGLAVMGVLQLGGLAMLITGLAVRRPTTPSHGKRSPTWTVSPSFTPDRASISLSSQF